MNLFGNLIWILFGGALIAIEYFMAGICLCLTVVGIPFGIQSFKLGMLALWPFGAQIGDTQTGSGCLNLLMNVLWFFWGFLIILTHLAFALLLFITIIGIPFALQHLKLARLAFSPFGKTININL